MTQTASPAPPQDLLPFAGPEGTGRASAGIKIAAEALGPLGKLPGTWTGTGFSALWRPRFDNPLQKQHFLQLNFTQETFTVNSIGGEVPNRGLVQDDIFLTGVRYLQQVHDGSGFVPPVGGGALHIEPGFFLLVPKTAEPEGPQSVVRLGSVPHGNALLATGQSFETPGPPPIAAASITPFRVVDPPAAPGDRQLVPFPESTLTNPPGIQRSDPLPTGVTQALVDDPNTLLTDRIADQQAAGATITHTTTLVVSTRTKPAGIENIPFLAPNADAVDLDAIFWIEKVQPATGPAFLQLQYTQTLMLNFNGLSWPHVSVANLLLTGA